MEAAKVQTNRHILEIEKVFQRILVQSSCEQVLHSSLLAAIPEPTYRSDGLLESSYRVYDDTVYDIPPPQPFVGFF